MRLRCRPIRLPIRDRENRRRSRRERPATTTTAAAIRQSLAAPDSPAVAQTEQADAQSEQVDNQSEGQDSQHEGDNPAQAIACKGLLTDNVQYDDQTGTCTAETGQDNGTDGQDTGLRLTLDPASASPQPGTIENRLTFDDVARTLAAEDIQIFAVSTENRPKVMAPEWLAAHRDKTLVTPEARRLAIPPYTLYLAELVRRTGGELYFLREAETMADTFRRIAQTIRAEYTLGYYPWFPSPASGHEGWHALRVEVRGQGNTVVIHRAAYYVPQAK